MALHEDHQNPEELTLGEKILRAIQGGSDAFQEIFSTEDSPSATDFSRASQPRRTTPAQGIFQNANRIFDDRSRGRVAANEERRKESLAQSLMALQQAEIRNKDSLAKNRPAKIDFQREKLEIEDINTQDEAAIKRERLEFDKGEAIANGDRENFINITNALRVLTEREKVLADIEEQTLTRPDRLQVLRGQATRDSSAGALSDEHVVDLRDTREGRNAEFFGSAERQEGAGVASRARAGTEQQRADQQGEFADAAGRQATVAEGRLDLGIQTRGFLNAIANSANEQDILEIGIKYIGLLEELGIDTTDPGAIGRAIESIFLLHLQEVLYPY